MLTVSVRRGIDCVATLSVESDACAHSEVLQSLKGLVELIMVKTPGEKAYFDECFAGLYTQTDANWHTCPMERSFAIGTFAVVLKITDSGTN